MMRRLAALSLALASCTTEPVSDETDPGNDLRGAPVAQSTEGAPGASNEPGDQAGEEPGDESSEEPDQDPGPQFEEQSLSPLVTDLCDEPTYSGVTWSTFTSAHFTLTFPAGSAPDVEHQQIADRLEQAYTDIRTNLGITAAPLITVNLSPSRVAAQANGKSMGRVWPNLRRYDVVYTGAADSYERVRYGKLLTAVLDYYTDSNNRYRLPVLATGVGELLDQSGRNLHDEYAKLMLSGDESRVRIAELESSDVYGENTGRAGSLVQFLVDRYGMPTFTDIYRATSVVWNGTCYVHGTGPCLDTPASMTALLDATLVAITGDSWSDVQPLWRAQLDDALARVSAGMSIETNVEVRNLFAVMDRAIATDDVAMYRSTLEGFYCEWGGDTERAAISDRAVHAYGTTTTHLLGLFDTGTKNFATASAFVMRVADAGLPMFQTIYLEHVPAGWRISYSPDWY